MDRTRLLASAVTAAAVIAAVLFARALGWLQPFEIFVYDFNVRHALPGPKPSEDIVLVTITERDIRELGRWPIGDAEFIEVLHALTAVGPSAIGVDVYRDIHVEPGSFEELQEIFRRDPRIFGVFRFGDGDGAVRGPPGLVEEGRVGFNDIANDPDSLVRRGLLYMDDGEGGAVEPSFALVVALRALAGEGVEPAPDPEEPAWLRLGPKTIRPFRGSDGGYAVADDGGYQMLLLASSFAQFDTLELREILRGDFDPKRIRNKIVLIGSTAESLGDRHYVPFRRDRASAALPGVEIHAAIAQQLVDLGLGRVEPLQVSSEATELFGIVVFAIAGCVLGLGGRGSTTRGFTAQVGAVSLGAAALLVLSALALRAGWWIPVVAPGLALVGSMGISASWSSSREREARTQLMQIFSRNVSPDIAEYLWLHREDFFTPEGRPRSKRMTATVMFTDMKGFTANAEKMDPELLMEWVNGFMEAMAHEVAIHGGLVDDYFGDGMKANFGVPYERSSEAEIAVDARNAVACALSMAKKLDEINAEYEARALPTIAMRIGINTGILVAGSVGSTEDRIKYTVVGDVVVTAQRLEAVVAVEHDFERNPCRILISEKTQSRLDETFRTESAGPVALKGKAVRVEVFRVLGRSFGNPGVG